jgi:hypothetical protein
MTRPRRHTAEEEEEQVSYPLTPEDVASLGRAFADAGRVGDGRELLAELRRETGLPPSPPPWDRGLSPSPGEIGGSITPAAEETRTTP